MPSSVIASYSYDPATQVLQIVFVSGAIYDYHEVPESVYNSMRRVKSKGAFFNTNIKDHYRFTHISG